MVESVREIVGRIKEEFWSETVQNIVETFSSKLLVIGIGLVTSILIARALGPAGKGTLTLAATIAALAASFGNFGIQSANTYYASQFRDQIDEILGNSILIAISSGSLIAFVLFGLYRLNIVGTTIGPVLLFLIILIIPLRLCNTYFTNLLLGMQNIRQFNIVEPVQGTTKLVLLGSVIAVNVIFGYQIVNYNVFFAMDIVTTVTILGYILYHLLGELETGPSVSWDLLRKMVSYGLRAYFSTLAMFIVIRFDIIMVGYLMGSEAVGYYSLSSSIINYLYVFPVSVGTVLFPKLSQMDDADEKWQIVRRAAVYVGLISIVLGVVGFLTADLLIPLLWGTAFLPSVTVFYWLLPALVFLSINTIFQNYFASEGHPILFSILVPMTGAIGNVALNWYLIPLYGTIGAAIASIVSYALIFCINGTVLLWRKELAP